MAIPNGQCSPRPIGPRIKPRGSILAIREITNFASPRIYVAACKEVF